jgi:hypothetical protein
MPLPLPAEQMSELIKTIGMSNGKPTNAFATALAAAITPDAKGDYSQAQPQLIKFLTTPDSMAALLAKPELLTPLVRTLNAAEFAGGTRTAIELLQKETTASLALFKELGTDKARALVSVMQSNNEVLVDAFVKKNFVAFKNFADSTTNIDAISDKKLVATIQELKDLNITHQQVRAIEKIANKGVDATAIAASVTVTDACGNKTLSAEKATALLLNAEARNGIERGGVDNFASLLRGDGKSAAGAIMTENNLKSLLEFSRSMESQKDSPVFKAVVKMITEQKTDAFTALDPNEIAAFFSTGQNDQAVRNFARAMEVPASTKAEVAAAINGFKKAVDYNANGKKESVIDVLKDRNGAKFFIEKMKDSTTSDLAALTQTELTSLLTTRNLLAKNEDALKALSEGFKPLQNLPPIKPDCPVQSAAR